MRTKTVRNEKISIGDALRHLGVRNSIAALAMMAVAAILTIAVFSSLYNSEREKIQIQGKVNAMQSADEFDAYIMLGTNVVKLSANTIDKLMRDGAADEAILSFMTDETANIQSTINKDFTGLYGWINRSYMDGAGWVPEPDYVAVERPWYTETMEKDTEISYITPYLDLDTGTVMMTITGRLSDGESLVALDIPLKRLQEITEEIAASSENSIGMVLDDRGGVVAHSDEDELGKDYLSEEEADTLGGIIAHKLIDEGETQFEVSCGGSNYIVYSEMIESGWYSVSATDADVILRPLRWIRIMAIIVILGSAIAITLVFARISMRELRARNLSTELATVADIYENVYDIDLVHDTFREISARTDISQTVSGHNGHAQDTIYETLDEYTDERSKHVAHEFADLSTLEERLKNRISVTEEFIGISGKWHRARFIASERDADGHLTHVMWLVECIDAEKRRSEELLRLSETDRMTGLLNRTSGEERVSEMLAENAGGMFIMLDADKFKSVNDTYGHDVGDEVLIAVANAMKNSLRSGDILMRIGGDEFAAFAPGVETKEDGGTMIRRLFDSLRSNHIDALGGETISVSVGAAFCREGEVISFSRLYRYADECMYESKRSGGHCVTYHDGSAVRT